MSNDLVFMKMRPNNWTVFLNNRNIGKIVRSVIWNEDEETRIYSSVDSQGWVISEDKTLAIAKARFKSADIQQQNNPVASNLYESFHGVAPVRKRKVFYEAPPKELICIGELSEIRYKPVRGKHVGTEFFHKSGDTGDKMLKTNLILATDSEGKNLYLLKKTKGGFPKFTSRGIIG